MKIRIINKSKKGVILDGQIELPWEQFNSMFSIKENVWAVPTKEYQEQLDKMNDLLDKVAVSTIMSKCEDQLMHLSIIGDAVETLTSEYKLTMQQVIALVQKRIKAVKDFGQPKANKEPKIKQATNKLGDFKGFEQLKAKFCK